MEYARDTRGISRRKQMYALQDRLQKKLHRLRPVHWMLIIMMFLCLIVFLYFGTGKFSDPEIQLVTNDIVNNQHIKHVVIDNIDTEVTTQPKTPSIAMGDGIKGDWRTDTINGVKIAWLYQSNIYETMGTLASVQGHDGCRCTVDNADVPHTYTKRSVAFGPFQADSNNSARSYFQGLVSAGYMEMSAFAELTNEQYKSYDTRLAIHKAMLAREAESKITFLANSLIAMQDAYLPESQLQKLEEILGKDRANIPEPIIGGLFSCNIYIGANFGNKYLSRINSNMSDIELVNTLYDTRKSLRDNDAPRCTHERALALLMLEQDFNGYSPQQVPGKGEVGWGNQMGIPGY